jgi:SPP1 family predicted phage head-tail adaptor
MRKTRASNYKHRVIIQKNTPTRGASGGEVDSWATFLNRRASIEPLIGRELFAAQQFQTETSVKIKMRYDDALDVLNGQDYRISYNSNIYKFEAAPINMFENNQELMIMCSVHNE